MYANVNAPPNMVAGINAPPNIPVPAPQMVAGVMEAPVMPMPHYAAPAYGYGCHAPCHGNTFLLIVVLFILLIIVGCSFPKC
ncbi:YjcZ family sporulation protein [Sutcliffiella sp. NPDC057660]|uniref:YjcZ family sporulation protein n=1 Tax=Sutcliffiella sp. NPDC057660 TaxID=3346199 RepID=UPI003683C6E3